ncbi:MAG: hypothetical protein ABI867_45300 [Kofleriaceae bacterium]
MRLALAFLLLLAATPALADKTSNSAELFSSTNMLVVRMLTNNEPLADIAGDKLKGTVRCYTTATKIHDIGCYVGIKRDGTFTAPVFTGKEGDARLGRMMPSIDGTWSWTYDKNKQLEIKLSGPLGNAVALWTGCAKGATLVCDEDAGMAGKYSTTERFVVLAGGNVRGAVAAEPAGKLDLSTAEKARATIRAVLAKNDKAAFRSCVSKRMLDAHAKDFDAYYATWQGSVGKVPENKWEKITVTNEGGQFKLDEN